MLPEEVRQRDRLVRRRRRPTGTAAAVTTTTSPLRFGWSESEPSTLRSSSLFMILRMTCLPGFAGSVRLANAFADRRADLLVGRERRRRRLRGVLEPVRVDVDLDRPAGPARLRDVVGRDRAPWAEPRARRRRRCSSTRRAPLACSETPPTVACVQHLVGVDRVPLRREAVVGARRTSSGCRPSARARCRASRRRPRRRCGCSSSRIATRSGRSAPGARRRRRTSA